MTEAHFLDHEGLLCVAHTYLCGGHVRHSLPSVLRHIITGDCRCNATRASPCSPWCADGCADGCNALTNFPQKSMICARLQVGRPQRLHRRRELHPMPASMLTRTGCYENFFLISNVRLPPRPLPRLFFWGFFWLTRLHFLAVAVRSIAV